MTTIHGIKNCDSVKKARRWLDNHGVDYQFRDFRQDAPSETEILEWFQQCDWQQVLNKRSTTWKQLAEEEREQLEGAEDAAKLMTSYPTLIKRPLLVHDGAITVGFGEARYQSLFD